MAGTDVRHSYLCFLGNGTCTRDSARVLRFGQVLPLTRITIAHRQETINAAERVRDLNEVKAA